MKNPANLPIDLSDYPPYMNGHSITISQSNNTGNVIYERVYNKNGITLFGIQINKSYYWI